MGGLADKFLASEDIPEDIVPVPEWGNGAEVLVVGMDAERRSEFIASTVDDEGNVAIDWKYYFVDVVIATAHDSKTREPIFTPGEHRERLVKKSGLVIDRLAKRGSELSGLDSTEAVERAGKGSRMTGNGSTSTP